MDNKKKFFIGLGVLSVVYMAVLSLNLTHSNESNKYSKEAVKQSILNGSPLPFNGFLDGIQEVFSFFLPEIDLLDVSILTNNCQFDKKNKYLIVTSQKMCVLRIKPSEENIRKLSLIYKRQKKTANSRGGKPFIKSHLMITKTAVLKPTVMMHAEAINGNNNSSGNSNSKKPSVEIIVINSDEDGSEKDKSIKENEMSHWNILDKGAEVSIKCNICQNYDVYISQNDD